jgi:4-amino-4-deoxy-L-arabinose transferase-like glycosyltransferase
LLAIGQPSAALFLALLMAAVVLRAYWVVHHSTVLDENGSEYARIAENLLHHGTYVGLFEGPELMFPPLFPVLLVLGSLFTGSIDAAARLIPFLAGVLLVPTAFALARFVYGLRVALGVAALTALHPVLIDLSSTAYSESIYLPLMLAGLYWALRALDSGSRAHTVCCGTMFGLAYLTRPEALLYPIVVLAATLTTDLRGSAFARRCAVRSLCLFTPIVVLVAPYAAYLSVHTGSLRFEGKGIMNYTIGERRNVGMPHHEASLGIGPNLSEDGPQLSPNHFIATAHRLPSIREVAKYWVESARRNKTTVWELLFAPQFGSVLAIGLMVLGLFRRPWHQRRALQEGVLIGVALGHFFLLLGLHAVLFRYIFPIFAVSLFWVSKGIEEAAQWAVGTARRALPLCRPPARWADTGIRCVLIVVLLLQALWGMRWGPLEDQGPKTVLLKEVGTWLGHHRPGPKRVMTMHPQVAYYSGGMLLLMPAAEASLALRYVHLKHPDFIVLLEDDGSTAAYLKQWLDEGIPDSAATLIYRAGNASHGSVAIYEWRG